MEISEVRTLLRIEANVSMPCQLFLKLSVHPLNILAKTTKLNLVIRLHKKDSTFPARDLEDSKGAQLGVKKTG
jgi:hypothetical protein